MGAIPTEAEANDIDFFYRNSKYEWPIFSINWDHPYIPCVCPVCGKVGIEFDGRGARVCGAKCCGNDDKGYSSNHPKIKKAYANARQARFEHGEKPVIQNIPDNGVKVYDWDDWI